MIRVNVVNEYGRLFIGSRKIRRISAFVLEEMKRENVGLSVVLCNDEKIKEYNRNFRKKDYPTDVLTFLDGGEEEDYTYLGDIIISMDRVKAQSVEHGVTRYEEFVRVLVHGILHLLGYDHEASKSEEKIMTELQDSIVGKVVKGLLK